MNRIPIKKTPSGCPQTVRTSAGSAGWCRWSWAPHIAPWTMSFSHWLVDENRGVWRFTPGKQQVCLMIDGIPAPGPSIFPKRTLLMNEFSLNGWYFLVIYHVFCLVGDLAYFPTGFNPPWLGNRLSEYCFFWEPLKQIQVMVTLCLLYGARMGCGRQ